MITIDFSCAIGVSFLVLTGAFFLLWIVSRRRMDKEQTLDPKHIRHCPICAHTYITTRQEEISSCPRCGSLHTP